MVTYAGQGVTGLRDIQFGIEETWGTNVVATRKFAAALQLTHQSEFYRGEDEERGSLVQLHRATRTQKHSDIRMTGSLQYEKIRHLLSMGMAVRSLTDGSAAGLDSDAGADGRKLTADGIWQPIVGSTAATAPTKAFTWEFFSAVGARNEFHPLTIEYGDNKQYYEAGSCLLRNLELRYEMGQAIMVSADIFGKAATPVTKTGDLQLKTINDAAAQDTTVSIMNPITFASATHTGSISSMKKVDADRETANSYEADMFGSTNGFGKSDHIQKGLVGSATVTIPTGLEIVRYSSGSIDYSDFSESRRSASMDLTVRHRADTNNTMFTKFRETNTGSRTLMIQLKTIGPTIETAGQVMNHIFEVVMALQFVDSPQFFTDNSGDNMYTIRGMTTHEPNWNHDMSIRVQTTDDE